MTTSCFNKGFFFHFTYSNIRNRGEKMKKIAEPSEAARLIMHIQEIRKEDRAKLTDFDITPFTAPFMTEEQQSKRNNR